MESRFDLLPVEVKRLIYQFDPTFNEIYCDVVNEMGHNNNKQLFDIYIKLDRGFTIRNFEMINWVIVPRYYNPQNKKIVGSYIRRLWRVQEPL